MKPVLFEGHDVVLGAPKNWNAEKQGECIGLPVMRERDGYLSCWELTDDERKAIAAGANVWLKIVGDGHPPVWIAVGRSPPPEPATT